LQKSCPLVKKKKCKGFPASGKKERKPGVFPISKGKAPGQWTSKKSLGMKGEKKSERARSPGRFLGKPENAPSLP